MTGLGCLHRELGHVRAPDNPPKRHTSGTHRILAPEETLARVMPFADALGITRVAMLTGLDRIGIPVAAAMRPNSRSVAVHQGKGITIAAAKASAVMEALECFHAENLALPLRLATHAEIAAVAPALDPARLPRATGRLSGTERLLWAEGRDLRSRRPLWVPYDLVTADYTASSLPARGLLRATTNGLASGNHPLEATLHALCEVVERDALARWRAAPVGEQDARAVDPATVDGAASRLLLPLFAAAAVTIRIWDITFLADLPCFACLAVSELADGVEPELGSGCHPDRDVALCRALTEAAQARLSVISGSRDDLPEKESWRGLAQRQAMARRWLAAPARRSFHAAPSWSNDTFAEDLAGGLACLAAAGFGQVAAVDLTRPEIGLPVMRVVVPGLAGP